MVMQPIADGLHITRKRESIWGKSASPEMASA